MQIAKEGRDMKDRLGQTTFLLFGADKPIEELPLMDDLTDSRERKEARPRVEKPVARPTSVIYVKRAKKAERHRDWVELCASCSEDIQCESCECGRPESAREKGSLEGAFIDARKEKTAENEKKGAAEEDTGKLRIRIVLCQKCKGDSRILSATAGECVVKFKTIEDSIRFYRRHGAFLEMEWAKNSYSEDRGIERKKALACGEERRLKVQILEKAFREDASAEDTGEVAQKHERLKRHRPFNGYSTEIHLANATGFCDIQSGENALQGETEDMSDTEAFQRSFRSEHRPVWGVDRGVFQIGEKDASDEFVMLASGKHTNVALQAALKEFSQEDIEKVVYSMSSHSFCLLAKHKYGTYVIQLVVSLIKSSTLEELVKKKIAPCAVSLLQHEIGNYVVQKMISFDAEFVLGSFLQDFEGILSNKIGVRAFKSCVKHFFPYRKDLIPRLCAVLSKEAPTEEQKILKIALKELSLVDMKEKQMEFK